MKKILVLLGMIALASGAWAEEEWPHSYNWSFFVENVPYPDASSFPEDMQAYIIDTHTKVEGTKTGYKELAYITLEDANKGFDTMGKTVDNQTWKLSPALESTKRYFTYTKMSSGDGYTAQFLAQLRTEEFIDGEYNKGTSIQADYSQDLAMVIFSEKTGRWQTFLPSGGTYQNLQFAATYSPVPEPTSGLLLLLGVAGLALKRKKAA